MFRSVRIHEFGDASVLRIEDVEVQEPASSEVRLRIHAIGLNRTEITLRSGRSPVKPALPTGIGCPGVTGFSVGDRVALVPAYGAAQYSLHGELAVAPARSLVAIPDQVSVTDAAATWAAYGTAWGGLVAVGALKPGQTVLIPAASSSVGLAAIQIANRLCAHPLALTRTSAKADALSHLGALTVIATTEQDVVAEVENVTGGKGAQLVFDPVGGPEFATLARATAAGGTRALRRVRHAADRRAVVGDPKTKFAAGAVSPTLSMPPAEASWHSSGTRVPCRIPIGAAGRCRFPHLTSIPSRNPSRPLVACPRCRRGQ